MFAFAAGTARYAAGSDDLLRAHVCSRGDGDVSAGLAHSARIDYLHYQRSAYPPDALLLTSLNNPQNILELSGELAEPGALSARFANALCTTVNW